MESVEKPLLIVYVAAAVAIALIGARYLQQQQASATALPATPVAASGAPAAFKKAGPKRIVVDVAGAVRRPGLTTLRPGARAGEAIRRAGGPAPSARLEAVNLAMRLVDGQQLLVPSRDAAAGVSGPGGQAPSSGPISLNAATAEQLDGLDGVGPGLAKKIIDARTAQGGFGSVDELANVSGIGEKRLESLRAQLQP